MVFSLRIARNGLRLLSRPNAKMMPRMRVGQVSGIRSFHNQYEDLSYEEFTKSFEQQFDEAYDLFEVQRILNNVFSYDLVPAPTVIERALRAARRVNDYATASRVFEALREKVETQNQYQAYLDELKDVREELGIDLREELEHKA